MDSFKQTINGTLPLKNLLSLKRKMPYENVLSGFNEPKMKNVEDNRIDNQTDDKEPVVIHKEGKDSCRFAVGNNMFLAVNCWQGDLYVHVRVYEKGNNSWYPTKKGISFSLQQWKKLQDCEVENVDQAIAKFKEGKEVDIMKHLGSNYYVTVHNGYANVTLRRWWVPEGKKELCPSRKGVALTFEQWEQVKKYMGPIAAISGLDEVIPCEFQDDHQNQMGAIECNNCNPNRGILNDYY